MNGYSYADGQDGAAGPAPVEVPLGLTNQPRLLVRSMNRDEAVLHLNGVETAFANSLRRTCMADVPTVGEFSAFRVRWYKFALRWSRQVCLGDGLRAGDS